MGMEETVKSIGKCSGFDTYGPQPAPANSARTATATTEATASSSDASTSAEETVNNEGDVISLPKLARLGIATCVPGWEDAPLPAVASNNNSIINSKGSDKQHQNSKQKQTREGTAASTLESSTVGTAGSSAGASTSASASVTTQAHRCGDKDDATPEHVAKRPCLAQFTGNTASVGDSVEATATDSSVALASTEDA